MVKRTQTIRRLLPTNYLNLSDHFFGLTLTGLKINPLHATAHFAHPLKMSDVMF